MTTAGLISLFAEIEALDQQPTEKATRRLRETLSTKGAREVRYAALDKESDASSARSVAPKKYARFE